MTLPVDEFLRRFLLYLHPHGFVPIRNFGFLAEIHSSGHQLLVKLDRFPLPFAYNKVHSSSLRRGGRRVRNISAPFAARR